MYGGLNVFVDAFEKQIFENRGSSRIDVNYGLTKEEFQMFKKFFEYNSPNKLGNALINASEKKIS